MGFDVYTAWVEISASIVFVLAVLLGSYVQGVTGFAFSMIIMAAVVAVQAGEVPPLAAAISFLSLVNVLFALHGHSRKINVKLLVALSVGQIPAIACGVWLLTILDENAEALVELLLGTFVALGSLSMVIRPKPIVKASSFLHGSVAGALGGIVGGMFAASGPVIGWFCYRQPLPIAVIRATLLGGFIVTAVTRIVVVGLQGALTFDVWIMTATGLPVVAVGTLLGRRFPPRLSPIAMRRAVFSLTFVIGIWIIAAALVR
jgi:uncharacterized membrane protein YfcA